VESPEYLSRVAQSLELDGSTLSRQEILGLSALIGYRADFRWRWMASRLNLFTVVASVPPDFNATSFREFTAEALNYALEKKGLFRGFQNGIGVIPVVIGAGLSPEVRDYAASTVAKKFAAFAWPVAVDLPAGGISRHPGHILLGRAFNSWINERTRAVLPDPVDGPGS
jgi:hypothetical protein